MLYPQQVDADEEQGNHCGMPRIREDVGGREMMSYRLERNIPGTVELWPSPNTCATEEED
jgi:hypothetical protein